MALAKSNDKFYDRFAKVEEHFKASGEDMKDVGLKKLDEVWEDVKKRINDKR
jgi:uncharacterized protein YabN with tetrapyrrole methylase and pyrophosphatase domain